MKLARLLFPISLVAALVLGGVAASAPAADPDATPLVGAWPEPVPRVSVELDAVPIGEAIGEIARQAGWPLSLTASGEQRGATVTLGLRDLPATTALGAVLTGSGLEARLVEGVLVVRPAKAAPVHTLTLGSGDEDGDDDERAIQIVVEHDDSEARALGLEDRVNMGGPVVVEAGEEVYDAIAMGGPLTVRGTVRGDAVSMGGPVSVEDGALVHGDVVAMGGPVEVRSGARVKGDVTAVGGPLDIQPGALVEGNQVGLGGPIGGILGAMVRSALGLGEMSPFALGLIVGVVRLALLLALGLLFLAFLPERVERIRAFLVERPGPSVLGGLALAGGFFPAIVLLAVTVIGIPLIPVLVIALAVVMAMGFTVVAGWVGDRVPLLAERKTPVVAFVIGVVALTLVQLVPWIGTPLVVLCVLAAGGATVLSRFGREGEVAPPSPAAEAPREIVQTG